MNRKLFSKLWDKSCGLLVAGLLVGLAGCKASAEPTPILPLVPAQSTRQASGQFTLGECNIRGEYGPPGQAPGGENRIECGALTVPEDRQQNGSPKLDLDVTIFKSSADQPAADPVLLLSAPGYSGNQFFYLGMALRERLPEHDFIVLELRGSDQEPSLDCPEIYTFYSQNLAQDPGASDYLKQLQEAHRACRRRLEEAGVNLAAYTTPAMLADLVDLRLALNIAQWNVFSIENSRLALQLLREDLAGIRSLVLDSVVPPQIDFIAGQARSSEAALNLLFERCAAYERCNLAFPEVKKTFNEVVDQLNAKPLLVKSDATSGGQATEIYINGDRFIQVTLGVLSFSSQPGTVEELPKMIYEMKAGKQALFSKLLSYGQYSLMEVGSAVNWFQFCNEDLGERTTEDIIRSMGKVESQLSKAFEQAIAQNVEVCAVWRVPGFKSSLSNQPVKSSVPTLLFSGDYNPFAAPEWSDLAAETLNQATVIKFSGVGAYSRFSGRWGACADVIMTTFIEDPAKTPPTSCAQEEKTFIFITLPEFETP